MEPAQYDTEHAGEDGRRDALRQAHQCGEAGQGPAQRNLGPGLCAGSFFGVMAGLDDWRAVYQPRSGRDLAGRPGADSIDYLSVAAHGGELVAARSDGVVLSTDGGQSWMPIGIPAMLTRIHRAAFSADGVLWLGAQEGVYFSRDTGKTWMWIDRFPLSNVDDLTLTRTRTRYWSARRPAIRFMPSIRRRWNGSGRRPDSASIECARRASGCWRRRSLTACWWSRQPTTAETHAGYCALNFLRSPIRVSSLHAQSELAANGSRVPNSILQPLRQAFPRQQWKLKRGLESCALASLPIQIGQRTRIRQTYA